ncbi:hypothetical protein D9M70_581500 [compost metagenome]
MPGQGVEHHRGAVLQAYIAQRLLAEVGADVRLVRHQGGNRIAGVQEGAAGELQVAQGAGPFGAHFAVAQLQARLLQGVACLAQAQVVGAIDAALGGQLADPCARCGQLGLGGLALGFGLLIELA